MSVGDGIWLEKPTAAAMALNRGVTCHSSEARSVGGPSVEVVGSAPVARPPDKNSSIGAGAYIRKWGAVGCRGGGGIRGRGGSRGKI